MDSDSAAAVIALLRLLDAASAERRERCDELCTALQTQSPVASCVGLEGRNSAAQTAFLVACLQGHVECMELLAEAGCNTAAVSNDGLNALMYAACSGVAAAVRTVLTAGWCELEAKDKNGDTAFLVACFKGCVECMELLAEAGCNTAAVSNGGLNALMCAACSGIAAAPRTVLTAGWCDLEAKDKNGSTAFLHACFKGCVECMELLAEAGCNTAAVSNDGLNALMYAAWYGVAAAVRTVLTAGWCDLEAKDKNGCTAFLVACIKGHVECMELLAEAGCNTAAVSNDALADGANALMYAACSGVAAAVRTVLTAGWCELEAKDKNGDTAFLRSCIKGHVEGMELLAEAGCNTAAVSNCGLNALMYATCSGVAAAPRTVIAAGWCELEAKDKNGDLGERLQCVSDLEMHMKFNILERQALDALASGRLPEAKTAAGQAACLVPGSTRAAKLQEEVQRVVTQDFEEQERRARIAEAELMAMLDGKPVPAVSCAKQAEKARRKKQKRQRQRHAKREAALRPAQAVAEPEPEQALEQIPESESEPVPELDNQTRRSSSPAFQAPASPNVDLASDQSQICVQAPPTVLCCPITSECEQMISAWSAAQVLDWISTIGLSDHNAFTVRAAVQALVLDGDEFAALGIATLKKRLQKLGVDEPAALADRVLAARDAAMSNTEVALHATASTDAPCGGLGTNECPICFERYTAEAGTVRVPRILTCGHTFCQQCLATQLMPILAEGSTKRYSCPQCREITCVPKGQASRLTQNYALI